MANPEHLAILSQGVEQWNKWRTEQPNPRPRVSAADLSGADLKEMNLFGANFRGVDLRGANLGGAKLREARLGRARIIEPHLSVTHAFKANLRGASLTGADLSQADLFGVNPSGADLRKADLSWASVSMANLERADLRGADLTRADLDGATLSDADLTNAKLTGADLDLANLRGASLCGTYLIGADFGGANLSDTDFTGAMAGGTNFADVDLSIAKGLETVGHHGPSTIGIDTFYKSHGKIPEIFLRGCGVPDELIGYIKSVAGAIEFYSCFISYSTKDQEFAERLYNDLQGNGVRCWFAPHDIHGGRKLHEQIDDAIRMHDKLLLILSEHSMNSEWVKTEIAKARKRELREKRKMLFPVSLVPYDPVVKDWECFDADTGKDSAREIREYYIPDFSSWKNHDSYQKAFQRLVGDLKAVASG